MSASAPSVLTLETLRGIVAAKNLYLAFYTILLYDFFIQLPEEVSQMWKRNNLVAKGYLFLRYYSLLAPSIIAFGYFSPYVTGDICLHWMKFIPFGLIIPLSVMSGILMALRIYAMYGRNRALLTLLLLSLTAQAGLGLWIWATPGATFTPDPVNNYEFHYCIFIPAKSLGPHNPSVYAFTELSFDAFCFLLTLIRPFLGASGVRQWGKSLWMNLARNGALYFGVIFSVNLGWAIMILHAPSYIRGSLAAPSSMAMATFISRITLSLRYAVYGNDLTQIATQKGFTGASNELDESYQLGRMSAKKRTNQAPYSPTMDIDTSYLDGIDYNPHAWSHNDSQIQLTSYSGYGTRSPVQSDAHTQTQTRVNVEQNVVILRD